MLTTKSFTPAVTLMIAIGLALIVGATVFLVRASQIASLKKDLEKEKTHTQEITDEYNEKLGVAHANELAAREEVMKSNAMIAEYERRQGNIKALDTKLDQAETKYEQAKKEMGDCGETKEECLKKLCLELKNAGFKVKCD